jgi:hypothetical protein
MTLITLQDGKIVLRDGKVGTEQECCCCCVQLIAFPDVVGVYAEDWECCFKPMWEEYVARLAAAGWTATIVESEGQDPDGNPLIGISMNIDPCCELDCEHLNATNPDWNVNTREFSNQPEGFWVDLSVEGIFFDTPIGGLFFGGFAIGGCCRDYTMSPLLINGEEMAEVGPAGGHWIPVCNPLP